MTEELSVRTGPTAEVLCCAQSCLTLYDHMHCSSQATLSMVYSRQEYGSGLPFPSPGFKPVSLAFPALAGDSLPLYHLKIKQHGDSWRNETFKMRILKYLEKNGKNSFQYIL